MVSINDRIGPDNTPGNQDDGARIAAEMAEVFGWNVEPTEAELEDQYAATRRDEDDLLARYPGLWDKPDAELIDIIANPVLLFSDADEAAAAAAILLQRRLDGVNPRRPA